MALTASQRRRLPRAAFADQKNRRFPIPTKAQARAAGISEPQRIRTLRNALARAGQRQARGKKRVTPTMARRMVKSRGAGTVRSVKAPARRTRTTRRRRR